MAATDWTFYTKELGSNLGQSKDTIYNLLGMAKLMFPSHWHLLEANNAEESVEKVKVIDQLAVEKGRLSLFGRQIVYLAYPTSDKERGEDAEIVRSYLKKVGIDWNLWDMKGNRGRVEIDKIGPPSVPTGYIPPQWSGGIAAAMVLWEREIVKVLRRRRRMGTEDWEIEAHNLRSYRPANWTPFMGFPASVLHSGRVAAPGAFPSYFPWTWKFNGRNLAGKRGLLSSPGFKLPRYDISLSEMTDMGYELISWNPVAMVAMRQMEGIIYRAQAQLFLNLKSLGHLDALKFAEEVERERLTGWVIPKVHGNFFEGKSFNGLEYGPPGEIRRAPTLMTPEPVAARLESMLG